VAASADSPGAGGVGKTAAVHNLLRKLPSTLILALNGLLALNEGGSSESAAPKSAGAQGLTSPSALHGFLWLSHHTEINAANFVKLVKRGTRALQNKRHSHHELVTQGSGTIVLAEISQSVCPHWARCALRRSPTADGVAGSLILRKKLSGACQRIRASCAHLRRTIETRVAHPGMQVGRTPGHHVRRLLPAPAGKTPHGSSQCRANARIRSCPGTKTHTLAAASSRIDSASPLTSWSS